MYRVYYAAFEKDSSSTGTPPTPYKIVAVKFEPAPSVTATEASVQQQQPTVYPTANSVSSASQNTIPSAGVTSSYPVPRSQPTEPSPSIYQPPVS